MIEPLTQRIAEFAVYLRCHEIPADSSSVLDAQKITSRYLNDKALLRHCYRSCFCQSQEQWNQFDRLFDDFWNPERLRTRDSESDEMGKLTQGVVGSQRMLGFAGTSEDDQKAVDAGAGDFKALSLSDFRFVFNPLQMRMIEQLVNLLARRAKRQYYRREKINNKHGRLELSRSVQRSIRYQGKLLDFRYRAKRRRLPKFVLLLDVSQSMDVYAKLFLRFTRQLMTLFDQSEAFAFNTELIPLGRGLYSLKEHHIEAVLSDASKGWLGGTKIAESFRDFNQHHLVRCVDNKTTVVVFSDGCDTATPDELKPEVALIQLRAKKLIWVNPLLGRFVPGEADKNMDPLRAHIDAYHSAHHLESLIELQQELLA